MNLLIFHSLFFISLYRRVMRWSLVVDTMVRRRAFSGQGQKCIPMCKSPLDDLFHGIDTEAFDIMLQDNGDIMLLNPGDDILYDNGCIGCFAGITAGDIPVKILISHIREVFGQFGHNTGAVAFADGIGASAGKRTRVVRIPVAFSMVSCCLRRSAKKASSLA